MYSHDPYSSTGRRTHDCSLEGFLTYVDVSEDAVSSCPVLHVGLMGVVSFYSYPTEGCVDDLSAAKPMCHQAAYAAQGLDHTTWGGEDFHPQAAVTRPTPVLLPPKEDLARVFIGQLPYGITLTQLQYAVRVASGGRAHILYMERILNWKKNRAPTGCVHAYCRYDELDALLEADQTVLADEGGIWYGGASAAEMRQLNDYVASLARRGQSSQYRSAPGRCMTVQPARSNYIPNPMFVLPEC